MYEYLYNLSIAFSLRILLVDTTGCEVFTVSRKSYILYIPMCALIQSR